MIETDQDDIAAASDALAIAGLGFVGGMNRFGPAVLPAYAIPLNVRIPREE